MELFFHVWLDMESDLKNQAMWIPWRETKISMSRTDVYHFWIIEGIFESSWYYCVQSFFVLDLAHDAVMMDNRIWIHIIVLLDSEYDFYNFVLEALISFLLSSYFISSSAYRRKELETNEPSNGELWRWNKWTSSAK